MINKQFFRDIIDEFFYLYGFGKKEKEFQEFEKQLAIKKNEEIKKKIKQRNRLKWIRRKCF